MQTMIIRLNPGKLENPDMDLSYYISDRIEHVSSGRIQQDGYDFIDVEEGKSGPLMAIYLKTEDVNKHWSIVSELFQKEKMKGNDLSKSAEIYISQKDTDDIEDCKLVFPKEMVPSMHIRLVRLSKEYKEQLKDMMDEWSSTGEKIVPSAITKNDYHDFHYYLKNLEITQEKDGKVPDTTLFCLDEDRNIFVGAVNIRHYLTKEMLVNAGHIGDGIRPSERRKGYATAMIGLALKEARKLGN